MKILSLCFIFISSLAFAEETWEATEPYTIESIQSWQQSIKNWPWPSPPQYEVLLNSSGQKQLLLAVSGGSRSGQYVLFTQINNKWIPISEKIEQAHHAIEILPLSTQNWHDFETYIPLWGSGGKEVFISRYSWDGKRYILKSSTAANWCDVPRFTHEAGLCQNH